MTAARVLEALRSSGRTLAVAESLTGGLLADAFVRVPGASAVLLGGITAYATPLKRTLLGVDGALLAARGAVDAEVAAQMARGVRAALAVDARPADAGIATTGVAGPDPQDGHPPGTVFVAVAVGADAVVEGLLLPGDRAAVRAAAVDAAVALALATLAAEPRRPE